MAVALSEPEWTLGDRIWKARRNAGLEQTEVAQALGVSRALVSRWERDQSDPGVKQLSALAELTNVDPAWLGGFRTGSFLTADLAGLPSNSVPELPFPPHERHLALANTL